MTALQEQRRVPIDVTATELELITFALDLTAAIAEAEHKLAGITSEPATARQAKALAERIHHDLTRRNNLHSARLAARAAAREEHGWDRP